MGKKVLMAAIPVVLLVICIACAVSNVKLVSNILPVKQEKEAPKETAKKKPKKKATAADAKKNDLPKNMDPVDTKKKYDVIKTEGEVVDYSSSYVMVMNHACFEKYTYSHDTAQQYANVLNELTERLNGKATVYNMPIPMGCGIMAPDEHMGELCVPTPADEALNDMMSMCNKDVMQVSIYDELMSHRKEYLYMRTDHHWQARGAYYAYKHFCDRRGFKANKLKDYKKESADGFVGYFYSSTKSEDLKSHPDKVTVYYPKSKLKMNGMDQNGNKWSKMPVVKCVADYAGAFIAGDNKRCTITNKDIEKGKGPRAIVVKDSFGNAFIPFLADHYEKIYVVDFRYWDYKIPSYVKEHKVDDVIFALGYSNLRNKYSIGQIANLVKE